MGISDEVGQAKTMTDKFYTIERLFTRPGYYLPSMDKALQDMIKSVRPDAPSQEESPFYIGFRGSFGENHVSPRTIRAKHVGKLICLEGIVTKCK